MSSIIKSFEAIEDKKGRSLSFTTKSDIPSLSLVTVNEMEELSRKRNNCDLRICLHKNMNERLHQMVILHHRGIYRRPQKHIRRDETYQMIKGKMALLIFGTKGEVINAKILDKYDLFICRIRRGLWHVTIPVTPYVIFHEVKSGRFNRRLDSIYPLWAPKGHDRQENRIYYQKLLKRIKKNGNFS